MSDPTNLIRNVEVKYYRSINVAKVRDCRDFNVVTGPNDVGKSNFLRALNLFFNESAPDGTEIEFSNEFSHKRLEAVRKDSIKGKQFIQVTVEFNRGPFFPNTLPPRFSVTKTWYRDSIVAATTDNLQFHINSGKLKTTAVKARASLQKFLNRIVYTYVPAIKDSDTFQQILADLQEAMIGSSEKAGSSLTAQIRAFNDELRTQAAELRDDFTASTGINADISLPLSLRELFQSFSVRTDGIGGEFVSLDQRGDGIRVRFIPAILNYIAERSKLRHVWGFEEPENSMEFKRAFELSQKMTELYSKNAQIFITTHSPAFIDLTNKDQSLYVARRENDATTFNELNAKTASALYDGDAEIGLAEELGHIALMSKLHTQLSSAIDEAKAVKDTGLMIQAELESSKRPLILTEGKTDALLISCAWKKLYETEIPYSVKSCDTLPVDDPNEAAGASVLAGSLRTIRPDSPHITIGLFDRDAEGVSSFNLDKNFIALADVPDAKVHKNERSIALILPTPEFRVDNASNDNLPIEFLFENEVLLTKVGGRGIEVEFDPILTMCRGKVISKAPSNLPEHMRIKTGKVHFAEKVAPTLPKEAFSGFEPLFESIRLIVSKYGAKA